MEKTIHAGCAERYGMVLGLGAIDFLRKFFEGIISEIEIAKITNVAFELLGNQLTKEET